MRAPPVLGPPSTTSLQPALQPPEDPSRRPRMSIIPERDQFKIDEAKEEEGDQDDAGGVDERQV